MHHLEPIGRHALTLELLRRLPPMRLGHRHVHMDAPRTRLRLAPGTDKLSPEASVRQGCRVKNRCIINELPFASDVR